MEAQKYIVYKHDFVISVTLNAYDCIRGTVSGFKEASYMPAKITIPLPKKEGLKNISLLPSILLFRSTNQL